MKINKIKKLTVSMLTLLYVCLISSPIYASISMITADYTGDVDDTVASIGGDVLGIITTVGMIAAVVILVWLAISYISAAPEGKSKIKESSVIYVVGAIILFAASGLVKLLQAYGSTINASLVGK